jgi:hypothetical protein
MIDKEMQVYIDKINGMTGEKFKYYYCEHGYKLVNDNLTNVIPYIASRYQDCETFLILLKAYAYGIAKGRTLE